MRPKQPSRPSFVLAIVISLVGVLALSACGGTVQARVPIPDFLDHASSRTVSAYQYALHSGAELENYPCYCGCVALDHKNNRDCYIESIAEDGSVVWDSHAKDCGVCVDITQDARELRIKGWSATSIREFIDGKYSSVGPFTDTPLPVD
jgi:hypothetical protein